MKRIRSFSTTIVALRLWSAAWLPCLDAAHAGSVPLEPGAGMPFYQRRARIVVPGAWVDAAGGNLIVVRRDLSIDTRLGELAIDAAYNAGTGDWIWSFEASYDGASFVDATGHRHDVSSARAGDTLAGSVWVKLDARRLKTKGGLVHEFAPDGRLVRIRWSSSATPSLEFEAERIAGRDRTTAIVQCAEPDLCEPVVSIGYDAQGRVVGLRDRADRQVHFAWDASDRLVVARDPLDHAKGWPGFRYEYEGSLLVALTHSEGERIEFAYQERRVGEVRQIGEEHPVHTFAYGAPEEPDALYWTRHTDPLGARTEYRYDADRRLHELVNAVGERTRWSWQGRQVRTELDPAGLLRRWTYVDGDVATETEPSGNVIRYAYAPEGVDREHPQRRPRLRVEDTLGLIEERSYDAQGRLVALLNGAGEATRHAYHPDQMLASIVEASGVVTRFSDYGAHGHAELVTRGSRTVRFRYDGVGNRVAGDERSLDAGPGLGGIVSRAFDADRNLSTVELADLQGGTVVEQRSLTLEHGSDGRRLRVRRPYGGDVEFVYDTLGRLRERRERVDGGWRSTRIERDARGRPIALERANGTGEAWAYDAAGRWRARTLLREGAVEAHGEAWLRDGRVVAWVDSVHAAAERYYYDVFGRLALVRYPEGEVATLQRDLRGRPVRIELWLPGSGLLRALAFHYDAAGREVRIVDGGETVLERRYQEGRLAELRYGNGLRRSFRYDANSGALANVETLDAIASPVESTLLERLACSGFVCALSRTRSFGALDRLTVDHAVLGPATFSSLPEAGRRVAMDHRSQAWFDHPEDGYYDYDVLSNLVARIQGGGYRAFDYNPERNRLERIEATSSTSSHAYQYDAAGYATERDGVPITWDAAGRLSGIGSEVRLVWDAIGRPVRWRRDGSERRLRFGGLVETDTDGRPVRLDLRELTLELDSGERRYRHFDSRGNVKLVSDERGKIVTHYGYSAYGVASVHGASDDPVRFAQGVSLGDLVLLGHRLYDPAAARFLAPDPVEQIVNAYAYTLGNPIAFWDPGGAFAFDLTSWGMTVATVGAGMMVLPGSRGIGAVFFTLGIAITVSGGILALQAQGDPAAEAQPAGLPPAAPPSPGPSGGTAPGGAGSAPGAGVPAGCSPNGALLVDEAPWLLLALLPVQLVLTLRLVRARRSGARTEG